MSFKILYLFLITTFVIMLTFSFLSDDFQSRYGIYLSLGLFIILIISLIIFKIQKFRFPENFKGLTKEEYAKNLNSNGPLGKLEPFLNKKMLLTESANIQREAPTKIKFKNLPTRKKIIFIVVVFNFLIFLVLQMWELVLITLRNGSRI